MELVVEAEDLGSPPKRSTVHVDIRITQTVNAYPHWVHDYSTHVIELSENAPINTIVARLKAVAATPVATDPLMHYRIMPGETVQQNGEPRSFHLRISNDNEMLLMTYRALDFETTPKYTLTIKAAVSISKYTKCSSFFFRYFLVLHVRFILLELSFSKSGGVHDGLHISSADWWDLLLPLA